MQLSFHVKKGDNVFITTGKEKGKTGEITRVDRKNSRIYVKGINLIKKHVKPSASSAGGIESREASIHISNVMHVDPVSNGPTRIGYKIDDAGKKIRIARKSGEAIDR